jgi:cytochrome c oxidase assembly protein subunit 15
MAPLEESRSPWLHRYAVLTAVSTLLLIVAGGLVTSTGSGLAVPDWPLAYGMVFPPMVGGIFYEHGHRMIATFVGALTVGLALWLWRCEGRRWLRNLGLVALGAVIVQGLLGGMTVLFLLPPAVSIAHACLAQTFLCLTVGIATFTSKGWRVGAEPISEGDRIPLRSLCLLTTASVYMQLILGALVRHTGSGLAIPDFPLSFCRLLPPLSSLTVDPHAPFPVPLDVVRSRVMIQFAHRAWALAVLAGMAWTALRIYRIHRDRNALVRPASLMAGLVLLQVILGGSVIWTERAVPVTTAHVAVGASILAVSVMLLLRVWRLSAAGERRSRP